MTTTLDATRPWDLTTIQVMLMEGFKEGARLAVSDRQVREDAIDASDLEEAFSGVTLRSAERVARRLSDGLASDYPDRWAKGLEAVVTTAADAALVLGARAVAHADGEGTSDLAALAEDELWLGGAVERFLPQVLQALVAVGHPVPGAQAFLERVRPSPEPEIMGGAAGGIREVRTSWIHDADTGRAYQWCVLRDGDVLHLSRRRRGSRVPEETMALRVRDQAIVARLLARVTARV